VDDKQRVKNEQISHRKKSDSSAKLTDSQDKKSFSSKDLIEISKNQKNIIWLILIGLILPFISPHLALISSVIQVVFVYKLAVSIKTKFPGIYCFLMFIPLVSLIALLIINGEATSILKSNGIHVGLMGVQNSDISKLEQEIQIDERTDSLNKSSSSDNLESLEKLADLRDKSIITEEEFQEKKRQILGL
jgi:Short C-terminal domain